MVFQTLKDDAVKVLHSICQQIWKIQQWPHNWKRPVFIPIPKKGNTKDLHDPDDHDGVITHREPDIPECEVNWALESITTNKASGGDGIPVELFQILKDDAVKVLH